MTPPRLAAQMSLLWGLRLRLATSSLRSASPLLATLAGAIATIGLTVAAGQGAYAVLGHPAVLADPPLRRFLALLLGFLASTMWIVWPALTAGVDDAAELSRFALLPISRRRVFLASVLAGLVEPRVLPLWGALVGGTAALVEPGIGSAAVAAVGLLTLGLCSVAWGRVGLHLLLNLLRQRRSAEAIGGGLLALLFLTTLVPPPDLSWLSSLGSAVPRIDRSLLDGATALFALLPTGGWAAALLLDERGHRLAAVAVLAYTGIATVVGYQLALRLLERFHRAAGRALPQSVPPAARTRAYEGPSMALVLADRELNDVLSNPRVRVMAAMPFLLAILLQLSGARALAGIVAGARADAWLLGGLVSYAALLVAGGLGQNVFGYDGAGIRLLLATPRPLETVLRAKNAVHSGIAMTVGAFATAFYALRVGQPSTSLAVLALFQCAWQSVLLVAAGNVLSVLAPRRFHASLRRRDRPPAATLAATMILAAVTVAPWTLAVRRFDGATPTAGVWAVFAALLFGAMLFWQVSVRLAVRLAERRRPEMVQALVRE